MPNEEMRFITVRRLAALEELAAAATAVVQNRRAWDGEHSRMPYYVLRLGPAVDALAAVPPDVIAAVPEFQTPVRADCPHLEELRLWLREHGLSVFGEFTTEPHGWVNVYCVQCHMTVQVLLRLVSL